MSFTSSALAVLLVAVLPGAALAQRCDAATLGDAVCDCGCDAVDSSCGAGAKFNACAVSHCPPGEVPWEHGPSACMSSACGDGWKDSAAGEACDDGNALAGGGCSADCRQVTAGFQCGEGASGCLGPDAGVVLPDGGLGPAPNPSGGCGVVPGFSLGLAALLVLRRRPRA